MSEIARITVPFDPSRLSLNARLHWRVRAKIKKQAISAAAWGYREAGEPVASGPVRLSLLVRRQRVLDPDNAWAGVKEIKDYVFCGRMTPDDSGKWVKLGDVNFETGKAWKSCPEVVLIVETLS